MLTPMKNIALAAICLAAGLAARADQYDYADVANSGRIKAPMYVDLRDVARYVPTNAKDYMPDASVIMDSIKNSWSLWGTAGEAVYGSVVLQEYPYTIAGSSSAVDYRNLSAFIKKADNSFVFRFFEVVVDSVKGSRAVKSVVMQREVPLSESDFSLNASIAEQQLVVEDIKNDIRMIYPIGVGSIDPGLMTPGKYESLTPMFAGAKLEKAKAYSRRSNPAYYRGQPFMPITNRLGVRTSIAFHITILSDADWKARGPNFLVRGYDSHGCMRLRQKDLSELANILLNGTKPSLPVNVTLFANNESGYQDVGSNVAADRAEGLIRSIHPYPYQMKYYQRVKKFPDGTYHRDSEEHLVITEKASGVVDVTKLSAFSVDDMTAEQMRKILAEDVKASQ